MSTFVLYIATTLDGYIASPDGSIEWLTSLETQLGEDNGYGAFYETIDALIMGSATYEQVLGFGDWAYPGKLSYVLTKCRLSINREDILFMPTIDAILADLSNRGFRRIWIVGGAKLAALFMQQGLIDEYIITIIPIILGTGIGLYESVPEKKLHLIHTKTYSSGAVELHYRNKPI